MKQNNPCYLFGMYGPDTGFVIINAINDTYTGTPIVISCEEYNSAVLLDTPDDIVYLYRLAQESPLLYVEPACKINGLQFLLHLLQFIQQCWFSWISLHQFLN